MDAWETRLFDEYNDEAPMTEEEAWAEVYEEEEV